MKIYLLIKESGLHDSYSSSVELIYKSFDDANKKCIELNSNINEFKKYVDELFIKYDKDNRGIYIKIPKEAKEKISQELKKFNFDISSVSKYSDEYTTLYRVEERDVI